MTDATTQAATAPVSAPAPVSAADAADAAEQNFVKLCVPLTGFAAYDLNGTGMARLYLATAAEQLGGQDGAHLNEFLQEWAEVYGQGHGPDRLSARNREIARALVYLWYTGAWPRLAPAVHGALRREVPNKEFMASPASYAEGLVWRAFGGHPGGAKPPSFGTWRVEPGPLPALADISTELITADPPAQGAPAPRYESSAYGAEPAGGEVPHRQLPGQRASRGISPSAVPPAAPHRTQTKAGE